MNGRYGSTRDFRGFGPILGTPAWVNTRRTTPLWMCSSRAMVPMVHFSA